MRMIKLKLLFLFALIGAICLSSSSGKDLPVGLAPDDLVAWCVVPFDASKRGPEERATMLKDLGFKRCAYDWRPGYEVMFEAEIEAYQKHGIEMFAFWKGHELAYELFRKHDIQPQLWHTVRGESGDSFEEKVTATVAAMEPLAKQAVSYGGTLGLYNHGGWGGEPKSLVAVCEGLRSKGYEKVGIVYNFHHGHDQIERWEEAFSKMKPYLLCLNLNGMTENEVTKQNKILLLGDGEAEAEMLRVAIESGYEGPFGILDHQMETDARETLIKNLEGLERLVNEATGR